jgi:hypothetical protein
MGIEDAIETARGVIANKPEAMSIAPGFRTTIGLLPDQAA